MGPFALSVPRGDLPETGIEVADFTLADADDLVAMWRASFEHGVGIVDPHPLAEQKHYLLAELAPHNRIRVARQDCEIVGFLASTPESITQLYVRVRCIGRGIGSHLLALAKAESSGSLWLYTFARNANARRFYARRGFVAIEHGFEPTWQLADVKYRWEQAAASAVGAAR